MTNFPQVNDVTIAFGGLKPEEMRDWKKEAEEAHKAMEELKKWIEEEIKHNKWAWDSDKTFYQTTMQSVRDKITELEKEIP